MSYLIHFNPNHDPKTGRFTFNTQVTAKSKKDNYLRTINRLSGDEYTLFTLDGDEETRKNEPKFIKEYMNYQKDHKDAYVFVSKYGNVTMANIETSDSGDEWNIGWATDPKYRGTGVTQVNIKEAIAEIRKYSDLPISATINESNIPSQKTAEKAGFKESGRTNVNGDTYKKYIYK